MSKVPTQPRLAYSYIRFSRPEQAKGDSIRRQTAATEAYCLANNLTLSTQAFSDKGISAFKGKNAVEGALRAFRDAVESGKIREPEPDG